MFDSLFYSSPAGQARYLFIDMNSFYTSVEQQECEAHRGQPTIVVPTLGTDSTCAIAASYEAKRLGIKTGTRVGHARLTPGLHIVEARPELYLAYHSRIVDILHRWFANVKILSVDEMACKMPSTCRTREQEEGLARRVKQEIADELGAYMRCSVGVAQNIFLAKVAGDVVKPDGLTVWRDEDMPYCLYPLKLKDLPGIGPAIEQRLNNQGITTLETLWNTTPDSLRRAWGSVVGARFWYMLRGSQQVGCDYQGMLGASRKSVGHSNVLAPDYRSVEGAQEILLQLTAKALQRLRAYDQAASALSITVKYQRGRHVPGAATNFYKEFSWPRSSRKHLHSNDDATWIPILRRLLVNMPRYDDRITPYFVGVTFSDLLKREDMTLSLFEEDNRQQQLAAIVDGLNRRFGKTTQLAATTEHEGAVPKRIPFGAPEPVR